MVQHMRQYLSQIMANLRLYEIADPAGPYVAALQCALQRECDFKEQLAVLLTSCKIHLSIVNSLRLAAWYTSVLVLAIGIPYYPIPRVWMATTKDRSSPLWPHTTVMRQLLDSLRGSLTILDIKYLHTYDGLLIHTTTVAEYISPLYLEW
ncbi:hypothetical protein G9A89_000306 [Geosiphon pyriformis]|nr:hypothetical protein G9A89_000301 [Geosiphon pyriformis]KAG9304719.1 hypothetical protein G9A89_000306 [Geosiphon pyriformis]